MKYCVKCNYPENHPLHLTFDRDGVCSGCIVHEEKDTLDWKSREEKLKKILDSFRNKNSTNYDCIIPISGGRDSYFIVDLLKNRYNMNPLLVSYNSHYNTSYGIANIMHLRTMLDCDHISLTLKPNLIKAINLETLRLRASMYWHCIAGQTVYPVQVAVGYKIPLIVWGAHQGCDQVGMYSHCDEVEMTRRYRYEHDLMCLDAESLADTSSELPERELKPLFYPEDKEISLVGVRGIYLNNYIRWDTRTQHLQMLKKYGYHVIPQKRTFDNYSDPDSTHYSGIHDFLKLIKYGYCKVFDHTSREIRLKRITRDEGLVLIKKYINTRSGDLQTFFHWMGISENYFFKLVDQFRNPQFWFKDSDNRWELKLELLTKISVSSDLELSALESKVAINDSRNIAQNISAEYHLLPRGYSAILKKELKIYEDNHHHRSQNGVN